MKINWGTGIIIFLVLFFISIFWFVFFSFSTQQDLVEEDYYPKELQYNEHLQKQKNVKELGAEVSYEITEESLIFNFPKNQNYSKIKGQIIMYRPSNKKLDQTYSIQLDTLNRQMLSTSKLLKGKYIVKIGWSYEGKAFYQEISIVY